MSTKFFVFYGSQLAFEFKSYREYDVIRQSMYMNNYDFYSKAWIYSPAQVKDSGWYRMDGTPRQESDVPKELRMLQLLMT